MALSGKRRRWGRHVGERILIAPAFDGMFGVGLR
jgi:hypothetical protein